MTVQTHKHEWTKITDKKQEGDNLVSVKTFSCKCGAVKIDTSQIFDLDRYKTMMNPPRDTQKMQIGEYENDRLVLAAFVSFFRESDSYQHKRTAIVCTLQEVTLSFQKMLQQAERIVPKGTSVIQIVADRLEKFGFGYKAPEYFDVPFVIKIEPDKKGTENRMNTCLESMKLQPTRAMLLTLLQQFEITNTRLYQTLNRRYDYDSKGNNISIMHNAIYAILIDEIWNRNQESIDAKIIINKIEELLGLSIDQSTDLLNTVIKSGEIIQAAFGMLTVAGAKGILEKDHSPDGNRRRVK